MTERKKIYVAGAYSDTSVDRVLRNIGRGEHCALQLFKAGFAPFVPWFDKEFVIRDFETEFKLQDFYDYSIEWLKVSDAVFLIPNIKGLKDWQDSFGVKEELKVANDNGIPVFTDLNEMKAFFVFDEVQSKIDF
jgi:hypothetical protein